ncbi:tyrosine-type recombinase/integrase [Micromonospora sp. NPDC003197]
MADLTKAAGSPEEGTLPSLRHHFATRMITSRADPTAVQNALRHSSLRITLERTGAVPSVSAAATDLLDLSGRRRSSLLSAGRHGCTSGCTATPEP